MAHQHAHFLDVLPFDWSREESTEFLDILASAYPEPDQAKATAARVNVNPARVNWDRSAREIWNDLIEILSRKQALRHLVRTVLEDPTVSGYRPALSRLLDVPIQVDKAALVDLLTRAYWEPRASEKLLIISGIPTHDINWKRPMRQVWGQIIDLAHRNNRLTVLMDKIREDPKPEVKNFHTRLRDLMALRALSAVEILEIADCLSSHLASPSSTEACTSFRALGIPLHHIYWDQSSVYIWREIVEVARRNNTLLQLLKHIWEPAPNEISTLTTIQAIPTPLIRDLLNAHNSRPL